MIIYIGVIDMKKSIITLMVSVILISLPGCGDRKNVDYDVSEEVTTTESVEEIPSEMVATLYGNDVCLDIDAELIVPEEYEKCAVLSVVPDYFEESDIEEMCNKIFDEGSYFLYMPYNMEQINLLYDKIDRLRIIGEDEYDPELTAIMLDLELDIIDFQEGNVEIEIDGYRYYHIEKTGCLETGRDLCEVLGQIDGEWYSLIFDNSYGTSSMRLTKMCDTYDAGLIRILPDYRNVNHHEFDELEYTVDQAQDMAKNYIEDLGYKDFEVDKIVEVINMNSDVETGKCVDCAEGYLISFGRNYGNYTTVFDGSSDMIETTFTPTITDISVESINIFVTNEGVVGFEVINPHRVDSILSESTTMLPYEKIEGIVDEWLGPSAGEGLYMNYEVDEVKLGYRMVTYEDGNKALVPAWHFIMNNNDEGNYINDIVLVVNAIDGTIVWNSLYGY